MVSIGKNLDRVKEQGNAPFLMWVIAKFFFGLGIAFLIAGAFPGFWWIFWGLVFIVLGIILAIPMMRLFFRKH